MQQVNQRIPTAGARVTDHHRHDDAFDPDEQWPDTESVTLRSVGIDIGSSTAHVVLSTIVMERQGVRLSSQFDVVERTVDARSPVWFTPYTEVGLIDAERIAELIAMAYDGMGVSPEGIDTGAVIVTGEAARRTNADRIVEAVADYAGHFVCAVAGPVLEGVLAAHGAGAVAYASGEGRPLLNVDIGGGTTKIAHVEGGRVSHVHAINIGGRLLAWDDDRRIVRLEDAGAALAAAAGVEVAPGITLGHEAARQIAATCADVILDAMRGSAHHELAEQLAITRPLGEHGTSRIMFSGGVGHLVGQHGDQRQDYGDLGDLIGVAVAERVATEGCWEVVAAKETLRATAVGVGQFTLQLSGNTISVTDSSVLPLRNLQVVGVELASISDAEAVRRGIEHALIRTERADGDGPLALALQIPPPDSPSSLVALADGIVKGLPTMFSSDDALVITLDQDVAGMLGHLLREGSDDLGAVVILDQVVVDDLDYLDVGRLRPGTGVVPIVVKSLVF